MDKIYRAVLTALAALGSYLCYLLGGWDTALKLMFLCMALDYITGVTAALLQKSGKTPDGSFRSAVAFRGLTKKLMMIVIVMLGVACDRMLGTDNVCRIAVISFYVANEGLSILENAHLLGVPVPRIILEMLDKLKKRGDSENDSTPPSAQ